MLLRDCHTQMYKHNNDSGITFPRFVLVCRVVEGHSRPGSTRHTADAKISASMALDDTLGVFWECVVMTWFAACVKKKATLLNTSKSASQKDFNNTGKKCPCCSCQNKKEGCTGSPAQRCGAYPLSSAFVSLTKIAVSRVGGRLVVASASAVCLGGVRREREIIFNRRDTARDSSQRMNHGCMKKVIRADVS